MFKIFIAGFITFNSLTVFAQDLPPASDFYYCAHYYKWLGEQLKEPSPLKTHVSTSLNLFESGADVLNWGSINKADSDVAADRLNANLKRATEEKQTMGDIFKTTDGECWNLQRRHMSTMLKKSAEVGAAQKPYFTHTLTPGQVDAADIGKRQDFIKSQTGVSVSDQKNMTIYSFARKIGGAKETVHHLFTREGHSAHPAIIFVSSRQDVRSGPAAQTNTGSYAGSKTEFDAFYTAFVMMNQVR
jgi:hypothetical protein